jgi:RNA polymerase sigma factor (sigma-70 family)
MADERQAPLLVYVVDDDASIRDSLSLLLGLAGYSTRLFVDAESCLAALDRRAAGCVVADLRLPGMSGLELQAKVRELGSRIPFVIITAHGDVPAARAAFRAEAVDFIEKPFDSAQLTAAIEAAFEQERTRSQRSEARRIRSELLGRLTARERDVLEKAAQGLHAKEIAAALGISPRTVEVHKMRLMEKLEVRNIGELVRFAMDAEQKPADSVTNRGKMRD